MRSKNSMVWLLVFMTIAACGDGSTSSGADATVTSTDTSIGTSAPNDPAVSSTEPPSLTSPTDVPPPTSELPTTTTPPTTSGSVAAGGTPDVILPVVAAMFSDNEFWNIVDVDVPDCQNGYARVFALADQSGCDPEFPICLENEQVFLVDVDGSWQYLEAGTGIECENPSRLSPEMIAACDALGLP